MIPGEAWAALGLIGGAIATGIFSWLTALRGKPANDMATAPQSVTDAYDAAIKTLAAALDGLQEDQAADRTRIVVLEREREASRVEITSLRERLGILEVAWEYIGSLLTAWVGDPPPEPPTSLLRHIPDSLREAIIKHFPHVNR